MKLLVIGILGLLVFQGCDRRPRPDEKKEVKVKTHRPLPKYHALDQERFDTTEQEYRKAIGPQMMGFNCWMCEKEDSVLDAYRVIILQSFEKASYYQLTRTKKLVFLEAKWTDIFHHSDMLQHKENRKSQGLAYKGFNKILDTTEEDSLNKFLKEFNFWNRRQEEQKQWFDGSHWVVEGYKAGNVQQLYFTSPEADKEKNRVLLRFGRFLEGLLTRDTK